MHEFSYFPHYNSKPTTDNLEHVIQGIRDESFKKDIEALRKGLAEHGQKWYDARKRNLPSWAFGAILSERTLTPDAQPSGLACLDIDKLKDARKTRRRIAKDEHVLASFMSPSENGFKALIRLDPVPEIQPGDDLGSEYTTAYRALMHHFAERWKIRLTKFDTTSDMNRLCFVSHDPEATYNPDATPFKWQEHPAPETNSIDELKGRHALVNCHFTHGDSTAQDVADATHEMIRYIDGKFRVTIKQLPIWLAASQSDLHGAMSAVGACYECRRQRADHVLRIIRERDHELKLNAHATFYVDGEIWHVGPGEGRLRLRKSRFDDHLYLMPQLHIPHPTSDEWRERRAKDPAFVDRGIRRSWYWHGDEVNWLQRFLSRMLDDSQRRGPAILGWSSTGKGVLQEMLALALPEDAVMTISAEDLDQYAAADYMDAKLVIVDEAQEVPKSGWAMAKTRSGKGRGKRRAMRESGKSERSKSSLMVFAEVDEWGFTRYYRQGSGWDNRLAYVVADKPPADFEEDPQFYTDMTNDDNVIDLMLWIIDGFNTNDKASTRRTPNMMGFAAEVWNAASATDEKGHDIPTPIRHPNGEPVDPNAFVEHARKTDHKHRAKEIAADALRLCDANGHVPDPANILAPTKRSGRPKRKGRQVHPAERQRAHEGDPRRPGLLRKARRRDVRYRTTQGITSRARVARHMWARIMRARHVTRVYRKHQKACVCVYSTHTQYGFRNWAITRVARDARLAIGVKRNG